MKNKLLYRKSLGRLACTLFMMVLSTQLSWGQDQVIGAFPYMQGGFENQAALAPLGTALSSTLWSRTATAGASSVINSATEARTGTKYARGISSGTQKALQSPTSTTILPTASTSYVVQFWVKNYNVVATTYQVGVHITTAGTGATNTAVSGMPSGSPTWTKVSAVTTTPAGTPSTGYVYLGRAIGTSTANDVEIDDVVVYPGNAVDETLPDNPTAVLASAVGDNQQTISWTAAAVDGDDLNGVGGVDGGGYIVVRGTAAIASTPNANGIYGVNNEVVAGEKVVYVGTGVSFVDTGLLPATTYYYKIYSVDKAFNYGGTPITVNSTTTGSITPVITASTTALSGFLATNASASTSQSFSVTGLNLTNDLVVSTVSTDYELSTDAAFTSPAGAASINLGSGPTVSSTPIYVRLKSGLLGGDKTANISVASTGAAVLPDVVCTGGVSATYYYLGTGALTTSTNWGINTDGSGTQPTAVTDSYATFVLRNTTAVATDATWTLGTSSKLVVGEAGQPAIALTVASTFPIAGTIDIAAASSGANSLIWQDTSSPIFGALNSSSEVYLQPTAISTYFFTPTPTFGKLIIDGINAVGIGNSFSIATSLNVASNSVLNLAYGGTIFSTLGAGATATINGKINTSKGSNGEMFTFNNVGNGALRFFDPITTPSILTLGPDSIVELSNSATGASGTQTVSVLPVGVTYANLILTATAGPNTKNITAAVTVTNKLTINLVTGATLNLGAGLLTLKSTATKTAVVAELTTTPTINGTLVAERYIPAGNRAYRLLSPATTGGTIQANWQEGQADGADLNVGFGTHITGTGAAANGFDTTTSNAASLFTHTNTGAPAAWTAVANTNVNTLTAGSPYLIYLRGSRLATNKGGSLTNDATTLRTTGALATGTQVVSGLNTTADGFSLIGNPYQAQVDMQAVLLASTDLVQGFYYVVDPSLGSKGAYYTVDVTAASTADYSKYLQPGQACFVKTVATPTAPALSFLEANKSETDAQTSIFRTKNTVMSNIDLTLLDGASNRLDVLKVAFDASETNDVNQNDATKLTNFDENMATSNSSKLLSIEKRAIAVETDEIPLNISKYRETSYVINAKGTGLSGATPYLVDAFANTITEIPQDGSIDYAYTVDTATPASIAADRFKITYTNKTLKTIDNALEGFTLYPNPSKSNSFNVVVPQSMSGASLTVSNLLGQKLYSQNDLQSGATARVNVSNVKTAGVYLVSLTSEGKTATTKWIVE